jgi:hypothetical protein
LNAFDRIQGILFRTTLEKAQQFPMPTCREFLQRLKSTRWYAISSDAEIASIWDIIRTDPWVTDLVLDTTIDFDLQLRVNELPTLEELGRCIGESIDALKKSTIADADFTTRSVPNGMGKAMKENPWLTICYLMSRIDLKAVNAVMDAMNRAVNGNQKQT